MYIRNVVRKRGIGSTEQKSVERFALSCLQIKPTHTELDRLCLRIQIMWLHNIDCASEKLQKYLANGMCVLCSFSSYDVMVSPLPIIGLASALPKIRLIVCALPRHCRPSENLSVSPIINVTIQDIFLSVQDKSFVTRQSMWCVAVLKTYDRYPEPCPAYPYTPDVDNV